MLYGYRAKAGAGHIGSRIRREGSVCSSSFSEPGESEIVEEDEKFHEGDDGDAHPKSQLAYRINQNSDRTPPPMLRFEIPPTSARRFSNP